MRIPVESAKTDDYFPQVGQLGSYKSVARVLVADTALPSRLALKSILSTAGYAVTGAACAAEARWMLDESEYQLVVADLRAESDQAGPGVLAYARQKKFRPATLLIESDMSESVGLSQEEQPIRVSNEDVCNLLDRVASLISERADRRSRLASLTPTLFD